MSDKCPMCNGPVKITGHESNTKEGYTIKLPTYTSTTAEQLATEHENVLTLKDELANALSRNDAAAEQPRTHKDAVLNLNKQVNELKQQLADKERELAKAEKKIYEAHLDHRLAQGKLTAANAVVEQGEKVTKHGLFDCTATDFIELRHRCERYRKLQGGE